MGSIAIVGIGQASEEDLPFSVAERLRLADRVVVASHDSYAGKALSASHVEAQSFADMGIPANAPTEQVVDALHSLAQSGNVVLVSAGYPFMKAGIVSGLLARTMDPVQVYPTESPLQILMLAFDMDLTADVDIVQAQALRQFQAVRGTHVLVTGVSNPLLARLVRESFSDIYPPHHSVVLAEKVEGGGFGLRMSTLEDLGETDDVALDTAVYVPPSRIEPPGGLYGLVRIVELLRSPDGCPWDRKQTHESLRTNMIEEAYEVVGAIDEGDPEHLKEELGDTLLQIALHAQIAADSGDFDIDEVADAISTKLRRRHPHIFGTESAETPEEVLHNWEAIKRDEKAGKELLEGIAESLPALMYAQKMSKRVAAVGFDWESVDDVWAKVTEEIGELKETAPGSPEAEDEVGDLLFTVVNVARKMGVDAETALRNACWKFRGRFAEVENAALKSGKNLTDMKLDEMEEAWQRAKLAETGGPPPPQREGT